MVYKRKRVSRPYRRRYRRKTTMMRPRRPRGITSKPVYHFKRTFQALSQTTASTAVISDLYSFQITDLPNFSEFSNLFDSYRVNKVVLTFLPNHNTSQMGTAAQNIPNFHTVIDTSPSGSFPTTINQLYEYQTHRMTRGTQKHTRVWTPPTVDQNAQLQYKQWYNFDETNPPSSLSNSFFGLYSGIEPATPNSAIFNCYITLYFSCKNVK